MGQGPILFVSAGVVALFFVCELAAGGLFVAGYPVSERMLGDDDDSDNHRQGDYARYLYVMGLMLCLAGCVALLLTCIPYVWAYRLGAVLVIFFSLVQLFIMVQVQAQSSETLTYPRCDYDNVYSERLCSGDKILFVASVLFMLLSSAEIAYAVFRIAVPSETED